MYRRSVLLQSSAIYQVKLYLHIAYMSLNSTQNHLCDLCKCSLLGSVCAVVWF